MFVQIHVLMNATEMKFLRSLNIRIHILFRIFGIFFSYSVCSRNMTVHDERMFCFRHFGHFQVFHFRIYSLPSLSENEFEFINF